MDNKDKQQVVSKKRSFICTRYQSRRKGTAYISFLQIVCRFLRVSAHFIYHLYSLLCILPLLVIAISQSCLSRCITHCELRIFLVYLSG